MAKYKGFEIDDSVYSIVRYMGNVKNYYEELQRQQVSWDYLSVMAKLASLENELSNARKDFTHLTGVLLNRLGLETLNKFADEYTFKAQVAINILNRNLFERTADIGFLATDEEIRGFLKQCSSIVDSKNIEDQRHQLRARFQEYINKYSVYNDVVLVDKEGHVLVRLDKSQTIKQSHAPLIKQSLTTKNAYVETYGEVDFIADRQNNLIYSYRVEAEDGEALGVICLCFKFENECAGIFKRLLDQDDHAMLMLLSQEGHVLASSDVDQVPLSTRFKITQGLPFNLITYNGREYFCCTKSADAFQGYQCAGWMGLLMVPMDAIFQQRHQLKASVFAPEVIAAAQNGHLFNAETKSITLQANQIQSALDRSVWNGNVYQASEKNGTDAAVSKVLLGEIKNTGISTKRIFEHSISEIQTTIISTTLKQAESLAVLAMEMMDRNLYERANDCRWWALNNSFRRLLSQHSLGQKNLTAADVNAMTHILKNINDLYSVYDNLLVFDRQGKVLAISNDAYASLVGVTLQEHWVHSVALLKTTEHYAVSAFVDTPLYQHQPSYIYAAAIRDVNDARVVGGIAVVFDAKVQFSAMLQDAMPARFDADSQENRFSVFVDRHKKIISSNHDTFKVGEYLDIEEDFFNLEKGQSRSFIKIFKQKYFAIGCSKSAGYREYKDHNDRYQEEIYAFVLIEIGDVQAISLSEQSRQDEPPQMLFGHQGKTQLATFFVDGHWLGFNSERVASAVSVKQLVPIHGEENTLIAGYMMYKGDSMMVIHTSVLLGAPQPPLQAVNEAVVIKMAGKFVGLTIDRLGEIIDINNEMLQPMSEQLNVEDNVVRQMVVTSRGQTDQNMLKVMDVDLIEQVFNKIAS